MASPTSPGTARHALDSLDSHLAIPATPTKGSGRRPSWIQNIGARFSALASSDQIHQAQGSFVSTAASPPSADGTAATSPKNSTQALTELINNNNSAQNRPPVLNLSIPPDDQSRPPSAKSPSSSFFSSAFRRLSSSRSSATAANRQIANAPIPIAPRQILNVNANRARCNVPELDGPSNLRRVSFSVDVQIVGPNEPPPSSRPSKRVSKKARKKEEKVAERALKREKLLKSVSDLRLSEPKSDDAVSQSSSSENNTPTSSAAPGAVPTSGPKSEVGLVAETLISCACPSIASAPAASAPILVTAEASQASRCSSCASRLLQGAAISPKDPSDHPSFSTPRAATPPQAHSRSDKTTISALNKITTDPLRIYRRCCQLRETPVLKRIADQLTAVRALHLKEPLKPGEKPPPIFGGEIPTVPTLDLSNSYLQYPDFITLADWLAIVPVSRLILENADVRDVPLRAILSGLLAVRVQPKVANSALTSPDGTGASTPKYRDMEGVIEHLSLSKNRHITAMGWRYISFFANMCESLKALDLSYVPFPKNADLVGARNGQPIPAPQSPSSPTLKQESHWMHVPHFPHLGHASQRDEDAVQTPHKANPTIQQPPAPLPVADIFAVSLSLRRGGSTLEELRLGNCGLSTKTISKIAQAATGCGIRRFSVAGHVLDDDSMAAILSYVKSGQCQGLDLSSVELGQFVGPLTECIGEISSDPNCSLKTLCFANTGLDLDMLQRLLTEVRKLPRLSFIDISLNNVSLSPEEASEIAEMLPHTEVRGLSGSQKFSDTAITSESERSDTLEESPSVSDKTNGAHELMAQEPASFLALKGEPDENVEHVGLSLESAH